MAKVSAKRQITLPIEQCVKAHIDAGDEVECYVDRQGVISIIKKDRGAAKGFLKNIKINHNVSEDKSMESGMNK